MTEIIAQRWFIANFFFLDYVNSMYEATGGRFCGRASDKGSKGKGSNPTEREAFFFFCFNQILLYLFLLAFTSGVPLMRPLNRCCIFNCVLWKSYNKKCKPSWAAWGLGLNKPRLDKKVEEQVLTIFIDRMVLSPTGSLSSSDMTTQLAMIVRMMVHSNTGQLTNLTSWESRLIGGSAQRKLSGPTG